MKTAKSKDLDFGEETEAARTQEPRPAAEGTFTRYVQALAARSEDLSSLAEETLTTLRRTLVRELHRRTLWNSPPAYVGVYGWPSWTPGDTRGTSSPLDELLSDCYHYVFCEQLPRLLNRLRVNPAIDGLVVFHLRNFLHQRQKDHDPLGYRIFEMLRGAVRIAVAAQELYVLKGTRTIRNDTILGATSDADPGRIAGAADLRPIAARWADDLLPGLVTAEGAERREVTGRLRGHLPDLEAEGIAVFLFKDLIDVLKQDVRARWAGLYGRDQGEAVVEQDDEGVRAVIRLFHPSTRAEDLDSFKKLVACVAERIGKLGGQERTRRHLARLWNFLRRFAVDDEHEQLPSNRQLKEVLGIPRDRFPGLFATLGRLIRRCQEMLSGVVVELSPGRRRAPGNATGGRDG